MNEPTERAQAHTGKVTATQLRAVVKAGTDYLSLHGVAVHDRPSYSDSFTFTVRATSRKRPRGSDSRGVETHVELDAPGWVSNGNTSEREESPRTTSGQPYMRYVQAYRPLRGFWALPYCETLKNVLDLLPGDALVAFHVYLDAGTNEYHVRADSALPRIDVAHGLHSDHLYLVATCTVRGRTVERKFLIDVTSGAHNSARFGSPRHEADGQGH